VIGIGAIYALSLGLIVAGVQLEVFPESWTGGLYITWAAAGLGLAALAIFRRD